MSDTPNLVPAQTDTPAADVTPDTLLDTPAVVEGDKESDVPEGTEGTPEGGDAAPPGADTDKGDVIAPESYADFSMPEGIELDAAAIELATPLFKELGLTQEQAQTLVDFQAQQVQAGAKGQQDSYDQLMEGWKTASQNDSEFGGDDFEKSIGIARTAIDKFGTPELSKLLHEQGIGNNPEMIRFMWKVGKLTSEDNPGGGSPASAPAPDRVSVLYPNS